jgi:hypothetical protein
LAAIYDFQSVAQCASMGMTGTMILVHMHTTIMAITGQSMHSHKQSTDDKKQQLLTALSSLDSRVELVNSHAVIRAKCKTEKTQGTIEILADSGTSPSSSFTHTRSDLGDYEQLDNDSVGKTRVPL